MQRNPGDQLNMEVAGLAWELELALGFSEHPQVCGSAGMQIQSLSRATMTHGEALACELRWYVQMAQ